MVASCEELKIRYPEAETTRFGDSPELSDRLIVLIRLGKKTATCGSLKSYRNDNEPIPVEGRCDIVLDWDGTPALVIETTEVTVRRFCEVDDDFALSEGEDESLEGWRAGHRAFFERNGGWDPVMELVCERFRLIEDLADH